jgi:hypothetical protein
MFFGVGRGGGDERLHLCKIKKVGKCCLNEWQNGEYKNMDNQKISVGICHK